MILTRPGNKTKLAAKLESYFPVGYECYVEPFCGALGMYCHKKYKAKHNLLNDLDRDVWNLWDCMDKRAEELKDAWETVPFCEDLFNHWVKNKETDPIKAACRFIFLSNCSYLGKSDLILTQCFGNDIDRFPLAHKKTMEFIKGVKFYNKDAAKFVSSLVLTYKDPARIFIYNDPPYLGTGDNYSTGKWDESALNRLYDALGEHPWKWALSEFSGGFAEAEAKKRGFWVHEIGERKNILNRRTEILITNYEPPKQNLFN